LTRERTFLVVLAMFGASLLLVVAVNRWAEPSDEYAYWVGGHRALTGQHLYNPTDTSVTPYAYWYPPIVAQVLAPMVAVVPPVAFSAAWVVLMLACLWWLAGRNVLVALAMCAFPPIAVEFWFRNVHLVLAVLLVLGLRHCGGWFVVGAAIKLAPGLGLLYLATQERWREVAVGAGFGGVLLLGSIAISPDAWRQFLEILLARGPTDASGFLPIPYFVRALAGVVLTVVAARLRPGIGGPLFVVAAVLALPTLWFNALSTLAAVVPLMREPELRNA
jgi:glycosyl transferase family 87